MKVSVEIGTVNKSGVNKFFNGGDRVYTSHIYILSGEIISLFKTIKMEIELLLQGKVEPSLSSVKSTSISSCGNKCI